MTAKKPDIFEQLRAPFPPELVSWRAQHVYGSKALALAYIDARDVMRRLDETVGPACWTDTYEETPSGRVICHLSLKIEDEWIMKCDGAGDSDIEGAKGGISDAFKRAAVKWGIGRYLYDTPTVWAPCDVQERNGKNIWKAWKQPEADAMFAKALQGIAPAPEPKADKHHNLKTELRLFSREIEACGDWDQWIALREEPESKRLMAACEKNLPEWWDKMQERIGQLEKQFANQIKDYART